MRAAGLVDYDWLYRHTDYGHAVDRANAFLGMLAGIAPTDAIEVSAGRGALAGRLVARGIKVVCTETSDHLLQRFRAGGQSCAYWALPARCPLPAADLVTCSDVLEHLQPDSVRPAVRALGEAATRYLAITVCTKPSAMREDWFTERGVQHEAMQLHPTVWTAEEWSQVLYEQLCVEWFDGPRVRMGGGAFAPALYTTLDAYTPFFLFERLPGGCLLLGNGPSRGKPDDLIREHRLYRLMNGALDERYPVPVYGCNAAYRDLPLQAVGVIDPDIAAEVKANYKGTVVHNYRDVGNTGAMMMSWCADRGHNPIWLSGFDMTAAPSLYHGSPNYRKAPSAHLREQCERVMLEYPHVSWRFL